MITRRKLLGTGLAAMAGTALLRAQEAGPFHSVAPTPPTAGEIRGRGRTPVITPNGTSLPWRMEGGVKVFHLIAEQVKREFAPGLIVDAWGYNGSTPGPTIEAFEGDRVRLLVTNRLPEGTSVHWHGVLLPNGMDGVSGLTQPKIRPGETYAYEFTLRQSGTLMYHPHFDEMTQMALGMMGFFIIHPRDANIRRVDRDFAIFAHEWFVKPGTTRPDPSVMLDFNLFTFNSKVFPATDQLIIRKGDRVRLRLANLSMNSHPLHIHGHKMEVTGTDAGALQRSAWWPETTINVPVGTTRDVEFVADNPGDWVFHCHKAHHTMNQMGHGLPNLLGVDTEGIEEPVERIVPGTMIMGQTGMGGMTEHMTNIPRNSLPMGGGIGPFGPMEMGGMFTIFKVRETVADYDRDPGWYQHPPGTVAWRVDEMTEAPPAGAHQGHGRHSHR
jgi:manganese oxidase